MATNYDKEAGNQLVEELINLGVKEDHFRRWSEPNKLQILADTLRGSSEGLKKVERYSDDMFGKGVTIKQP